MAVFVSLLLVLGSHTFAAVAIRTLVAEGMERSAQREIRNGAWQRKTFEFCVNSHFKIHCEGDNERMEILQAVYNRKARSPAGEECKAAHDGTWESCEVDGKQTVKEQCEGTQHCHLVPTDHPSCPDQAFTCMRLRIQCSVGEPRPEPPRTQTGGMITALASTTPDVAELVHQAAHLPESAQQYLPEAAKQLLPDLQESTTTEKPVLIAEVRPLSEVKNTITKEIENPYLVGLSLVPCFRWTRLQKMGNGEVLGDWRSWEILARLTNCGVQEGCFHLTFPHGKVYSDDQKPPPNAALVQGELTEEPDSYWVTFRGTGLKRNDYGTWGVCLPKTSDIEFAVALWDAMKKGHAAGKEDVNIHDMMSDMWRKLRIQGLYHTFGQPLPFLKTQLDWAAQNHVKT